MTRSSTPRHLVLPCPRRTDLSNGWPSCRRSGVPFVCVTLVEAVGSTPQDAGSKMLVTAEGLVTGTVGGGRVEHKAIEHARHDARRSRHARLSPNGAGGMESQARRRHDVRRHVKLFFETYNHSDWRIVVFGAGHVASAVVAVPRPARLPRDVHRSAGGMARPHPDRARLRKIRCDEPRTIVAELPDDAFVVCMTMGHATDRPILEEIFRQGRTFPFLGVIGSKAKRAVLLKELAAAGIPDEQAEHVSLPDRPRHRHEPAGRNCGQRRGPTDSRARPLARCRDQSRLDLRSTSNTSSESCQNFEISTLRELRFHPLGAREATRPSCKGKSLCLAAPRWECLPHGFTKRRMACSWCIMELPAQLRIAKLSPGLQIRVEIIGTLPRDCASLPTIGDMLP